MIRPLRGEIWLFKPDPSVGREQRGIRPGIVVSINTVNEGPRDLVVMVPVTSQERPGQEYPFHVVLSPDLTGLTRPSYAMCEQVRAVSLSRVYGRGPRANIDRDSLLEIEDSLRIILGL